MSIFTFSSYREFLQQTLQRMPRHGYGQLGKIAEALRVSPSIVTLVLQGKKDFTPEQGNDLCGYLELTDLETEYFLTLLALERAGTDSLQRRLRKQLSVIRSRSDQLKNRLPASGGLSEESKALFYSQWYFSGARMLASLPGAHSTESIADRLGLPRKVVKEVLDFLVQQQLCVERGGSLQMGPQSTHLGDESLLAARHHLNWRQKAAERVYAVKSDELFFTSPLSIAEKDIRKTRAVLMRAVEDVFKIVDPSPAETVACLNVDWFRW